MKQPTTQELLKQLEHISMSKLDSWAYFSGVLSGVIQGLSYTHQQSVNRELSDSIRSIEQVNGFVDQLEQI